MLLLLHRRPEVRMIPSPQCRITPSRKIRALARSSKLPRAPYCQEDLDSIQKLTTDDINQMVQNYKNGNLALRDTIIKQFHPLIHKYVRLIRGCKAKALINYDTIQFLALFRTGQSKTYSSAMGVIEYLGNLTQAMEESDIYNQIVLILLRALDKFKAQRGVNSLGFLITRMRWEIKNWLTLEVPEAYPPFSDNDIMDLYLYSEGQNTGLMQGNLDFNLEETQETEFTGLSEMTLAWIQETDDPLFRDLSTYQRQLLYLSFKEGLGVVKIAKRLSRDKDTIQRHLFETMEYLRNVAKEKDVQ